MPAIHIIQAEPDKLATILTELIPQSKRTFTSFEVFTIKIAFERLQNLTEADNSQYLEILS